MVVLSCLTTAAEAQDKVEPILNADLVSQYVWRGLDRGDVSIQPELGISWKGFSLSAWGSIGLSNSKDCKEIDLEASYKGIEPKSEGYQGYSYHTEICVACICSVSGKS